MHICMCDNVFFKKEVILFTCSEEGTEDGFGMVAAYLEGYFCECLFCNYSVNLYVWAYEFIVKKLDH